MQLETLLKGLTEPRILSDGTIRTPNNFMLWAARVIKDLIKLYESSEKITFEVQGKADSDRLQLVEYITRCNEQAITIYDLRKRLEPISLVEYQEAMNKDRE